MAVATAFAIKPLHTLFILKTNKFTILERRDDNDTCTISNWEQDKKEEAKHDDSLPVVDFAKLINAKNHAGSSCLLWSHLEKHGYIILTVSSSSIIAKILSEMERTLESDFFPPVAHHANCAGLQSGHVVYVSERGIPMYRLGYEHCDSIREVYRVHCGSPDSQPWPSSSSRQAWLRGLCVCRYICDVALKLTLGYDPSTRFGSGVASWKGDGSDLNRRAPYFSMPEGSLPDRKGDYSVHYAMHYFNASHPPPNFLTDDDDDTNTLLNVKTHVDPSLFVLEPYLAKVEGLQIRPTGSDYWVTIDGSSSKIQESLLGADVHPMVLFVGRAFAQVAKTKCNRNISPTLHRVIAPSRRNDNHGQPERRIVTIYEQKYEEFFPPPVFD